MIIFRRILLGIALLVGVYLVSPAEAQGRYWVLVNGALRYVGTVTIIGPVNITGATTVAGGLSTAGASNITSGLGVFAATTSRIGSTTLGSIAWTTDGIFNVQNNGQTIGSRIKVDATPSVSSCGGGSPAVTTGSTPFAGSVTVGTGSVATCTITFGGTAFPSTPFCTSNVATGTAANTRAIGTNASTTALVLVPESAWADSSVVTWTCVSPRA